MAETLKVNNDNDVSIEGLHSFNGTTRTYIDNATLTFTVYDEQDYVVTGTTDTAMAYQSGSNGVYIGVIDKAAGLTVGIIYRIVVSSSSHDMELIKTMPAEERTL